MDGVQDFSNDALCPKCNGGEWAEQLAKIIQLAIHIRLGVAEIT